MNNEDYLSHLEARLCWDTRNDDNQAMSDYVRLGQNLKRREVQIFRNFRNELVGMLRIPGKEVDRGTDLHPTRPYHPHELSLAKHLSDLPDTVGLTDQIRAEIRRGRQEHNQRWLQQDIPFQTNQEHNTMSSFGGSTNDTLSNDTPTSNKSANVRKAMLVLMQDYTSIKVVFTINLPFDPVAVGAQTGYTYLMPYAMDLRVGDAVVVPVTSGGFKIGQVIAVDAQPGLNLDAPFQYKWVVGKVDFQAYNERLMMEDRIGAKVQDLERENLRKNLVAGLMESMGSEAVGLIGALVGAQVPEVKTVQPEAVHAEE